jgi:hypothetical protein
MLEAMRRYSVATDHLAKYRKQLAEIDTAESQHNAKSIWDQV